LISFNAVKNFNAIEYCVKKIISLGYIIPGNPLLEGVHSQISSVINSSQPSPLPIISGCPTSPLSGTAAHPDKDKGEPPGRERKPAQPL